MPADDLIRQPHGGALRLSKHNRGGPGRAPSPVRRALALGPDEALAMLTAIADGYPVVRIVIGGRPRVRWVSPTVSERLKALSILAHNAFGTDEEK